MKSLKDFTTKYTLKKTTANSERGDLIGRFHSKLNAERLNTPYKPLSIKFVAVKVGHLSVSDLYFLFKSCQSGNNFSKVWWGSLKTKVDY